MRDTYRDRLERFTRLREEEERKGIRLGWARLTVFLLAFALYVAGDVTAGPGGRGLWGAAVLLLLVFAVLVVIHRRVRAREEWHGRLARINEEGLARLDRNWSGLPPSPLDPAPDHHPYALDLDLCGDASLFRLLGTVTTPPGAATLRQWLLAPAPPEEIRRRQEAVDELAPQIDLRQALEAEGESLASPSTEAVEDFLDWAEEEPWLPSRRLLRAGAWLIPAATLLFAVLHVRGVVNWPWWALTVAAAFLQAGSYQLRMHGIMRRVSAGEERFLRYAALLRRLKEMEAASPLLGELKEHVVSSPVSVGRELERLARRVSWAEVRHSSMAHVPLQALFLWDVHVLASLERWKARSGSHVRAWLEALGTLEALAALATLRADHSDWCFPEVEGKGDGKDEAGPRLTARGLGHPLLPQDRCVPNDVEVGPAGSFLFVTGSNMSGKSTLLRAVGSSAVLAQAGGPVPAMEMSMTSLRVQTSMRTADSLSEGISQYMAELNRIRQVVEAARASTGRQEAAGGRESGPPVLYLLDEPLQGTNEAERRVAVQTILGHLLDAGAIGCVATHDLQLDRTERLARAARAVHLEGTVREGEEGPLIDFDYRLRPGRATSTNALALLRAVGLGSGEEKEEVSDS